MKKIKPVRVVTHKELAKVLNLTPAQGVEMVFRAQLSALIVKAVARQRITHLQLAQRVGTSRSRVTALLNQNTTNISIEFMLRALHALGYEPQIKIKKAA